MFLAKDTVAGIEVAVKGLPPEVRHNKEEPENIRANFALVSRLHHPNIAAALDYAHGEKIVHRDVKPSNVMIETKPDGSVVARVLDFGLAAEIRSSVGRVSREIRDTSGTRPYMAPEQWRGAKQGPTTDQYALAAMFCELVTGEVPFASVFDTGDPVLMKTAVATDAPEFPKELPKTVRFALAKAEAERKAKEEAERQREPKAGDVKTITLPGGATMDFVWCPPGSFMMGSPETEEKRSKYETRHKVMLSQGFWIGKYEVTQRQWESVMGENPSDFKGANRPVEKVSWDDCQTFIRKVNAAGRVTVSLPTEAQWEYACRAGTMTPYNFGSSLNGDKANCDGNYPYGMVYKGKYRGWTQSVGSYSPNAWGLYDMHGNVWEWCADWDDGSNGSPVDSTSSTSGSRRAYRGGGWCDGAQFCRSAFSFRCESNRRFDYIGLRLVCLQL